MINLEKVGRKISELRMKKNMKQNELADALFVTHQAVSKWENGKSLPSIDILYSLTKLFDTSIDYLLDDTEIKDDDYKTMLKHLSREAVISKFLAKSNLAKDIDKIFYLLNIEERKKLLNLMITKQIHLEPEHIWHLLSKSERLFIIGVIVSNKYDYDLSIIYHQLNTQEQRIVVSKHLEGIYQYKLPHNRKGVIL